MENYTENFLNQNRDPYCPRSSWSSGKIKKKKKKKQFLKLGGEKFVVFLIK